VSSFFFKIFLWFWLALALLVATLLGVGMLLRPTEPQWRAIESPSRPPPHGDFLAPYAVFAADAWRTGGRDSLASYQARLQQEGGLRTHLVAGGTRDLLGLSLTPQQVEVANRVQTRQPVPHHRDHSETRGYPVEVAPGEWCTFLVDLPAPPRFPPWPRGAEGLLLLVALGTAGLVCYGLARYLTSPVVRLRDATRRLADGDLDARVTPALGRRRDELTDLGRDFDRMAARLQTLVELHRRLVRDISHELRSPLARLSVALGIARQSETQTARGAHERIELEIQRLSDLIGQILTLSRLESGELRPPDTQVDLQELVRDVVADARFEVEARGRLVEATAPTPVWVHGSPTLLRSAIENIVRNATRHTPAGSTVELSLSYGGGADGDPGPGAGIRQARLSVRDHGQGVPEEMLSEIFRPFYRVEESRGRDGGGVGLGLAISQRAAQVHGGDVRARNHPEGGLVVELILPAH
jgi:two-component system, OmpR family, sensor histidine kinase CpxA